MFQVRALKPHPWQCHARRPHARTKLPDVTAAGIRAVRQVRRRAGAAVLGPRRSRRGRSADRPGRRPRLRHRRADGWAPSGEIAEMVGIDSSPNMLEQAAARRRGLRFEAGDIAAGPRTPTTTSCSPTPPAVGARPSPACSRGGGGAAARRPARRPGAGERRPSVALRWPPGGGERAVPVGDGGMPPPDPVAVNVLAPEQYAILLDHLGAGASTSDSRCTGTSSTARPTSSSGPRARRSRGSSSVLPDRLDEPFVDEYRRRLLDTIGDAAPYFYPFKRIVWGR